jgi:hypothetical protein
MAGRVRLIVGREGARYGRPQRSASGREGEF